MGEAPPPCNTVAGSRRKPAVGGGGGGAAAHFRLPRHGRRKVLVVRLGGGAGARAPGGGGGGTRGRGRGLCLRRLKLRWLRRAVWQLAAFCVAALSGPPAPEGAPGAGAPRPPWTGVDPYLAAPFVPAVLLRRAAQDYSTC